MSLLDEVREAQHKKLCRVAQIAEGLDDEGPEFLELAADPSVTLRSLVTVLRRRGFTASEKTLGRHRRGECEC